MKKHKFKVVLINSKDSEETELQESFKSITFTTEVLSFKNHAFFINKIHEGDVQIPDIIFLSIDISIPEERKIIPDTRCYPAFRDKIIVVLSNSTTETFINETFILGANIYIKTPKNKEDFMEILEEVLKLNWQYFNSNLNIENFIFRF